MTNANKTPVDFKFEIAVIPVSDVDRAKDFYANLGWRLDADFAGPDDYRVIQFTPPGSAQGLYLVVSDIEAARKNLIDRGIKVSEAFHASGDVHVGNDEPFLFGRVRTNGLDPARGSYRSYASFSDPDGNGWLLQEVTTRLPGRVDANETAFASQTDLAAAFRRAAAAHGAHEKRNGGQHDVNWPDWYADYIVKEQAGQPLPQ
jgi:catechol 2,3-dioxygenase-like lactoylglutathione lyase family enzyme